MKFYNLTNLDVKVGDVAYQYTMRYRTEVVISEVFARAIAFHDPFGVNQFYLLNGLCYSYGVSWLLKPGYYDNDNDKWLLITKSIITSTANRIYEIL
jgi:hypothetical protein